MKTIAAVLIVPFLNILAFFDNLFRRPAPPLFKTETFPVFENDAQETVREIMARESVSPPPAVQAPKGIALRKSVMFRAHSGAYRSAKVVGWDADGALILSRKNGPPFRRFITV